MTGNLPLICLVSKNDLFTIFLKSNVLFFNFQFVLYTSEWRNELKNTMFFSFKKTCLCTYTNDSH